MFLKYLLMCCLLQQVVSQEMKDNCKFAHDILESSVKNLQTSKENCDQIFGQCFSEDSDNAQNGKCIEEHNDCITMVLYQYQDSIKESDYAMQLFTESLSNADGTCHAVCKYNLVFMKLVEKSMLCGLYSS
ncbi:hypothetical protein FF38_04677 [Lucilia cuprina]|uniref:Protein TsetseEP domain-containing protein n=1 Tax=Lucilia cuprina TaxID=7375 RepID=A0A0L0BXN8_LUCCU|nr:hypothetical protein CVS40_7922 [Lucilia cuprina]KNC24034.1 hypothetical protein FF38_04677 [Lucilia cuprina]